MLNLEKKYLIRCKKYLIISNISIRLGIELIVDNLFRQLTLRNLIVMFIQISWFEGHFFFFAILSGN